MTKKKKMKFYITIFILLLSICFIFGRNQDAVCNVKLFDDDDGWDGQPQNKVFSCTSKNGAPCSFKKEVVSDLKSDVKKVQVKNCDCKVEFLDSGSKVTMAKNISDGKTESMLDKSGSKVTLYYVKFECVKKIIKKADIKQKEYPGKWHIESVHAPGKCLKFDGQNNLQIGPCKKEDKTTIFKVSRQGGIYYNFANEGRGWKNLDVAASSRDNGAKIHSWSPHKGGNQKIQIENTGRLKFEHSGKCIDIAAGKKDDGSKVHQWDCHNGTNQKWKLKEVKIEKDEDDEKDKKDDKNEAKKLNAKNILPPPKPSLDDPKAGKQKKWYGILQIKSAGSKLCLGFNKKGIANAGKCNVYNRKQMWRIHRQGKNRYHVANFGFKKRNMAVLKDAKNNGALIAAKKRNKKKNQRIRIDKMKAKDTFRLNFEDSNKCLDNASKKVPADVIQWQCHTGNQQQWVITKIKKPKRKDDPNNQHMRFENPLWNEGWKKKRN